MADDPKRYSAVVREYGQQQVDYALVRADEWRSWAEQLDELLREIPLQCTPWVYADDGERVMVEMGADHVQVSKLRKRLYRVVAEADAYAAALTRAAVLAEQKSTDLADGLEDDECDTCGRSSSDCAWSWNELDNTRCCEECSHTRFGEDGESRG